MTTSCVECGFENRLEARFCESCGVTLRCQKCDAPIRARQNFCGNCGKLLSGIQGSLARVRTSRHLAEQFMAVGASAEGENKIVTLLFADVANSTALIHDLNAEEANAILEPTLDRMREAVERYEGTVTQTAGDGIMAIFGAPVAHEDHAVRACYAALDMQESMRRIAAEVRRQYGLVLQIRVGINSGQVLVKVKYQEGDAFVDYRAVGVTTHIASRVQSLATPGTILMTRESFALAKGFVHVGPFEQVAIRGMQAAVDVCELHGVNTRMRIQARAARGLSKFVGRGEEMALLERVAAHAREGRGRVVAFVGEAGAGKSRVIWEFTHSPALQGWLLLDAGSVSYGKATSYLPLVDLLARYFEIQPRDDERRVREKISTKLLALEEEKLFAQMPLFVGALGWGTGDDGWKDLSPAHRQRELFTAIKHLLIREAQEQPVCIVFEDLHWVDDETQVFLDALVDSLTATNILLLVNFRPEYEARWAKKSCYSQARIDPLSAASAAELLEALLGSDQELGPLKSALISVTEGNPLFIEESVRSLIESGVLAGAAGHWRPIAPIPNVFVPQSIEALLAARIDRLPSKVKEVLQCAAVIGNDIPLALLGAVAGVPQAELERSLRELQASEFVYEKKVFPESEYTFKHAMTREVAYSSLLRERRKALHAQVAQAMLRLAEGRLDEQVERLAHHAEQGELWPMAVEYLQRSGEKAFALYANADAAAYFEGALRALGHLGDSREVLEQHVDLRFELRNALIALCELDRIRDCLGQLEPILERLSDQGRSARYAAFKCNHHFLAGEQRAAIAIGESGLRLAREAGDARMQAELLYRLGQSYHLVGENAHAVDVLLESIRTTAEQRQRERFELSVIPAVVNRTWLATVLAECGNFKAGMTHAKRALEIAEETQHPLSQVLGWLAIGDLLRRKGELDGAIGALERGMKLCDRYILPIWRLRLLASLGAASGDRGRLTEAREMIDEALLGARRMHLMVDQPLLLVHSGQVSLLGGAVDEALAHAQRALELARAHEDKRNEPWARLLIARAAWMGGRANLAECRAQLDAAVQLALECGARPVAALSQAMLAAVCERQGDKVRSGELSAAAERAYVELDMRPLSYEPAR